MTETQSVVDTKDFVIPSFYDFWCACREERYTHYFCKGGRNSAKSTSISQRVIFDIIDLPVNALCMRKVANTMHESVYEQLKEATYLMGVQDEFTFQLSPLRIIYKARGNQIIFRGGDETTKLKSIKMSNFPIARVWIEELSDFKTHEEVQVVIDSILRDELLDELTYKFFYSYNPPKRKQHWLNRKCETQFIPSNTYIHNSCYLDNHFLAQQTLDEINNIKSTDLRKYNWMYLGQPTGGGVVPFDNLVFRRITSEEVEHFDNIRQGLDFGYANDPLAFIRTNYSKKNRKLFFADEIYGVKISNREFALEMKKRKYETIQTVADSAEPKSIDELKEFGLKIVGAKKGEGSVEYGEKWLDDLDEIIIDSERTPNVAREFESIDYQIDRLGNQQAKLEDEGNHTIDASRYALEKDMIRSKGLVVLSE